MASSYDETVHRVARRVLRDNPHAAANGETEQQVRSYFGDTLDTTPTPQFLSDVVDAVRDISDSSYVGFSD